MKQRMPMNITQPRGKTNIGSPSSAPLSRSRWRLASASSTITASTVSRVDCSGVSPSHNSALTPPAPAMPPMLKKP